MLYNTCSFTSHDTTPTVCRVGDVRMYSVVHFNIRFDIIKDNEGFNRDCLCFWGDFFTAMLRQSEF